jgi:hypothetical protein
MHACGTSLALSALVIDFNRLGAIDGFLFSATGNAIRSVFRPKNSLVAVDNTQDVHELTFVLLKALDVTIEKKLGWNLNTALAPNIVRESHL